MDILKWKNKYSIDCDIKYQSKSTRSTYKHCVSKFLNHFKIEKEPKSIATEKIKIWLLKFNTLNTRKQMLCSVNSFYRLTVGMPKKVASIPYPKRERKLPRVIETEYLNEKINKIQNLKHKTMIAFGYDCALRRSEVINFKISNIDRKRMLLLIENGKGNKDRYVPLSEPLLKLIENYFRAYRPVVYLFNGESKDSLKYSASSYNKIVKKYLGDQFSSHTLRHSGITAMHENGTDIATLAKHAGHSSTKTTEIYTHVSNKSLSRIKTPLSL